MKNKCVPFFVKIALLIIAVLPMVSFSDEVDLYLQVNCMPELKMFEVRRFEVNDMFGTGIYKKDFNGRLTGEKNVELLKKYNLVSLDDENIRCKIREHEYYFSPLTKGSFLLLEDGEIVLESIYFRYSNIAPKVNKIVISGSGYTRKAEVYYRPKDYNILKNFIFWFDRGWYKKRIRPKSIAELN